MLSLVPEYIFKTFDEATPEFLENLGIKAIILDIDNTLEPYENDLPGQNVLDWFSALKNKGIAAAFVSNNTKARVELFNKELGFVAFYKAKKPFKTKIVEAMNKLNVTPREAIFMGDQVFTDVLGAHMAKIPAILVPPIKDKRDIFTRLKRLFEKPIIKRYEKRRKI